jgi:hypothetical protein
MGIAANYLPLFIYAVLITRGGTVKEEGQPVTDGTRHAPCQVLAESLQGWPAYWYLFVLFGPGLSALLHVISQFFLHDRYDRR